MAYTNQKETLRYSPAIEVSSAYGTSGQWIKLAIASCSTAYETCQAVFLVNMAGAEYATSADRDDTFLVRAKYTYNSSSPYYFYAGTSVIVEAFNREITDFNPAADIALCLGDGGNGSLELWIKANVSYGRCYVTHLGGQDRKDDGQYEAGEWIIQTGQSWGSNHTTAGVTVLNGSWTKKAFSEVVVTGDDPRIKIDGDTDSHPGLELYENGTRKWIIYNNFTNDDLTFKTDSTVRMVIDDDGNVGIGTSPVSSVVRLDVAGGQTNLSADRYAAPALSIFNDGDNQYRYGMSIMAGTDDGTCVRGVLFMDGDGTEVGYINWSGGTVTYATFTGAHEAAVPPSTYVAGEDAYDYGTIVKVVSTSAGARQKQVNYVIAPTTATEDKSVIGVYSSNMDPDEAKRVNNHQVFSLGDGHILICNEGGDVESGDFICSSNTQGHGMKQDDDLMHNYTVAKALESVVWAQESGTEKLVACTYHCG